MSETVTGSATPFEKTDGIATSQSRVKSNILDRECNAFCRYLINQEPTLYVVNKYREAHCSCKSVRSDEVRQFDRILLAIATRHRFLAKLVDSYTTMFLKTSFVRKKLILLLAILESCAPTYRYFDYADDSSKTLLGIRMAGNILAFSFVCALATVLLMPLHVWFKLSRDKLQRRDRA